MVGGTSIGSLVGGLYCEDSNSETLRKRCRSFSMKMARYFDKVLDLTWPTTSMFTGRMNFKGICMRLCFVFSSGRAFNRLMYSVFGERQIEVNHDHLLLESPIPLVTFA